MTDSVMEQAIHVSVIGNGPERLQRLQKILLGTHGIWGQLTKFGRRNAN